MSFAEQLKKIIHSTKKKTDKKNPLPPPPPEDGKRRALIACKVCGTLFYRHGREKYHSPQCKRAARSVRRQKKVKNELHPRPCKTCGIWFTPQHGNQRYHDSVCAAHGILKNEAERIREKKIKKMKESQKDMFGMADKERERIR